MLPSLRGTSYQFGKASRRGRRVILERIYKMTEKKSYGVIYSNKLSQEMGDKRYIVIDIDTGEVLDNANGYGFKSEQNATRAFEYKLEHQEKEPVVPSKEDESLNEMTAARVFLAQHVEIQQALLNASSYDTYTELNDDSSIASVTIYDAEALGREYESFTPEVVDRILHEHGYTDLDFSPDTALKAFVKYF